MKTYRLLFLSVLISQSCCAVAALAQAPVASTADLAQLPHLESNADQLTQIHHPKADPAKLAFGPGGPGPGFGPGGPGPEFEPGGPGFGHGPGFGPGFGPGHGMMGPPFLCDGIDLSDDQVERVAAMRESNHDKAMTIIEKLHPLERQFREALSQPEINLADVNRLKSEIATQKSSLDQLHADEIIGTAQILTADQRKKIHQSMLRAEIGPMGMREHKPRHEGSDK